MMQRWKNVWAGGPVEKENLIKLKQEGTQVKLPEKSCKSKAVAGLLGPGLSTHTGVRRGSRGQSGRDAGSGAGGAGRTQLLPLTALQPGASGLPSPSRHAVVHGAELRPVPPAPHATQFIAVTQVSTGRCLKHGRHTAASNPHVGKPPEASSLGLRNEGVEEHGTEVRCGIVPRRWERRVLLKV